MLGLTPDDDAAVLCMIERINIASSVMSMTSSSSLPDLTGVYSITDWGHYCWIVMSKDRSYTSFVFLLHTSLAMSCMLLTPVQPPPTQGPAGGSVSSWVSGELSRFLQLDQLFPREIRSDTHAWAASPPNMGIATTFHSTWHTRNLRTLTPSKAHAGRSTPSTPY
jgi:hypothetical protein